MIFRLYSTAIKIITSRMSTYLHWTGVNVCVPLIGSNAIGKTRLIALARTYTTPNDPQKLPNTAIVFVKGHFLLTLDSSDPAAVYNAVDVVDEAEEAAAAPPLWDKIEAPLCRNRKLLLLPPLPLPDDIIVEEGVAANGWNAVVAGWNVAGAAGETTVEIAGDTIMERGRDDDDDDDDEEEDFVDGGTLLVVCTTIGNPKTTTDVLLLNRLVIKTNNVTTVTLLDVSGKDMTDRIESNLIDREQRIDVMMVMNANLLCLSEPTTTNGFFVVCPLWDR